MFQIVPGNFFGNSVSVSALSKMPKRGRGFSGKKLRMACGLQVLRIFLQNFGDLSQF